MRLILLLWAFLLSPAVYSADLQQLLQLVDYIGVDYAGAVADGNVINSGEYDEMREFSRGIALKINDITPGENKLRLLKQSQQLIARIESKAEVSEIRKITTAMRRTIIGTYKVTVIPRAAPRFENGVRLYQQHCASCHGNTGDGNGPLAAEMQPAPINFLDKKRYAQRTLYGLYNTITQGVAGTTMAAYQELSEGERWTLAFYVGRLAINDTDFRDIDQILEDQHLSTLRDVQQFTITTPAEARSYFGKPGAMLMAWLRMNPASLFSNKTPLDFSRHRLDDVATAYKKGDIDAAYKFAVEAYIDGFELIEQGLNAVDSELRLEIEQAMTGLRYQIRKQVDDDVLESSIIQLKGLLETTAERMADHSLTGSAAFTSALFILLREGLEALLVVAALIAFLVKTKHSNKVRYLHYGWIGALLAGFLTWWASVTIIEISGASREITEGIAALVAAFVLFYVGFWMHDKSTAAQWKAFIEKNMHKALTTGTLWGLTGLSFIAVYREVFESILFFQALWVQTDEAGGRMALAGIGTGFALLVVIAWAVFRFGMRLPLRQFFSISGILMFILSLIFAGKGVAALQEAGYIPISPVDFPRIDLLGIYPNLQGLLLQAGLLCLALILWYGGLSKRPEDKT